MFKQKDKEQAITFYNAFLKNSYSEWVSIKETAFWNKISLMFLLCNLLSNIKEYLGKEKEHEIKNCPELNHSFVHINAISSLTQNKIIRSSLHDIYKDMNIFNIKQNSEKKLITSYNGRDREIDPDIERIFNFWTETIKDYEEPQ